MPIFQASARSPSRPSIPPRPDITDPHIGTQKTPTLTAGIGARYVSRLPRDHPPCGAPVPEGPLLVSDCLYHNPPASATNSARFALGSADQDLGPPGAPVEGCADTAPPLSSPESAGWSREQRGGRMAPLRWGVRESPSAVAGTDGKQPGRAAGSPPHRRKKCPLTPKKRPGPPRSEAGNGIMQLKKQRPVFRPVFRPPLRGIRAASALPGHPDNLAQRSLPCQFRMVSPEFQEGSKSTQEATSLRPRHSSQGGCVA